MKKICYNCFYRGDIFRLYNGKDKNGKNKTFPYHHCDNENIELYDKNNPSPWDSLYTIFEICKLFTPKKGEK